jgi:hypothetical protein
MQDPLQAAEFKLGNARLFLQEMGEDLMPPSLTSPMAAVMESSGVIVGSPWQQGKFWAHLGAFLAMARSVPDVIQWWCGFDPRMNSCASRAVPVQFRTDTILAVRDHGSNPSSFQ